MSLRNLVIKVLKRFEKKQPIAQTVHNKLGLKPTPEDLRDYTARLNAIPALSEPDVWSIPKLPPVWNQLNLGSCGSHAGTEAVETLTLNHNSAHFMPLSKLYHYYYARKAEGTYPLDEGQNLRTICQTMLDNGNGLDYIWPYDITKFNVEPPVTAKMFSNFFGITSYRKVLSIQDMCSILAHNVPIIVGLDIYDSFMSLSPQMYQYMGTGNFVGGHAVLVTGYDKVNKVFSIRNSWGPNWGMNGNFIIDFDTFQKLSSKYGWYIVEVQDGLTFGSS